MDKKETNDGKSHSRRTQPHIADCHEEECRMPANYPSSAMYTEEVSKPKLKLSRKPICAKLNMLYHQFSVAPDW